MRGTKKIRRREVDADPIYNSKDVSVFVNKVMYGGKKSVAQRVIYKAFDRIREKLQTDPHEVFQKALRNIRPDVEVRSRRVGGATYQIPTPVRPERSLSLAMRWLVRYTRERSGRSMTEKLAAELIDASQNTGSAVRRREEAHRMAEANKAFSHFRW